MPVVTDRALINELMLLSEWQVDDYGSTVLTTTNLRGQMYLLDFKEKE